MGKIMDDPPSETVHLLERLKTGTEEATHFLAAPCDLEAPATVTDPLGSRCLRPFWCHSVESLLEFGFVRHIANVGHNPAVCRTAIGPE